MATETRKEELRERERVFIEESFQNQNTQAGVIETHAPDYVGHWFLPEDFDRGELVNTIDSLHASFSNLTCEEEWMVVGDDTVAFGFILSGTHDGEFMGIPPTDEEVSWPGIGAHRYEGDQVVEGWGITDDVSLLQQLGALE